ncbi:hypothetical protein [Glycomyces buryatensis]|uniref:Uncharacterized protein n=1 Tax=Glycomyces buryatensis TaxID=2570927 RepID=A0A4S8Q611_9ACTN|nr:hypothetical protein [Glycomyces buryatensis]THV35704.1 hypothetical protein FAB82_22780 [Glycomyces buryatensis]
MSARIAWDVASEDVTDPAEIASLIVETLNMVNPHGTRGITMWLGPIGAERDDMTLRLDLDPEPGGVPVASMEEIETLPEVTAETIGAAAVCWLPEGLIAVDPDIPGADITVMVDSSENLVHVAASEARVSIPEAIRLAQEYATTGQRPDLPAEQENSVGARWAPQPEMPVQDWSGETSEQDR